MTFSCYHLNRIKKGGASLSISGVEIIPVDHFDHDELERAVTGADAILSFISGLASKAIDKLLLPWQMPSWRCFKWTRTRRITSGSLLLKLTQPRTRLPTSEKLEGSQVTSHELLDQRNTSLQACKPANVLLMIHLAAFQWQRGGRSH
ncbi:hypothetical protein CCMA1212_007577 [Trichoderma ghanense]|uniref:NmrA-like domain-containing protein n=1 Tax=Trichoderma ghanense TaxID=65468 RepID=A0ABY2GXA4_9HYPO